MKSTLSYKPKAYMRKAIKFIVSHSCAGLLMDPGLGKTGITLASFKILKNEGLVRRMLVVAPKRPAKSVWTREVRKWAEFNDLTINVLHGKHRDELYNEKVDINVVTLEGLEWLFKKARGHGRKPWPWEMLVIDESSKFKNTQTVRFASLKPYITKFRRRVILTGSFASNGLMNIFGQVFILDLGNALGGFVTHYRAKYFDKIGYDWKLREGAEPKIYDAVRPLVLRMAAEDYLDLPELNFHNIEVELPEKARAVYDQMEEDMFAMLDGKKITAFNAGVATGKCRQIANGGVYDASKNAIKVHDEKTEALEDLIDELGGKPLMIAYEFGHDLDRLRKLLGKKVPCIGGGVSDKQQAWIEDAWNAGDLPQLLVQPASAAHGLNLQDAPESSLAFYSMLWDLELYEQLIHRLHRQGRRHGVNVYRILARDTIDYAQLAALNRKDRTQRALLKGLQDYRLSRV